MKPQPFARVMLICLCGLLTSTVAIAQVDTLSSYTTLQGTVRDGETRRPLDYVNVVVLGTSIGTVTNVDGGFILQVADSIPSRRLEISHLGYRSQIIPFDSTDVSGAVISLQPRSNTLPEVVVRATDPLRLVRNAVAKITTNYPNTHNMLTAFYRETVRKRRTYIDVTEASIQIYKTPYDEGIAGDRVAIYKGRRLVSPKVSDTLAVKLQGGPMLSVFVDVVKNPDVLFSEEALADYKFSMSDPVMLDDRPHYVVNVEPSRVQPYPLYYGQLFIDEATLAFTQVELHFSMKDRNKITAAILQRKPFSLRFRPTEMTWLITYRTENGVSYLNYVRNEIRFNCDWKRRLFATNYAVVSEMVVTDKQLRNVEPISWRNAFRERSILTDKVSDFYDENFWEGYNIIAPTESLLSAVNKLKKKYK
ncbi:MAG: carboxypeptidase-like regulatory domain-containing protein [Prevotellaceae bacterium]|jgi:hypothetical protein|nr:carboxypeptidase-like regulatory domain-containing protein [Prevotellaceae bacterium]